MEWKQIKVPSLSKITRRGSPPEPVKEATPEVDEAAGVAAGVATETVTSGDAGAEAPGVEHIEEEEEVDEEEKLSLRG